MTLMKRWIKLLLFAFAIAACAIVAITMWGNAGDPRILGKDEALHRYLFPWLNLMMLLGVVGVVILLIKYAVRSGIQEAQNPEPQKLKSAPRPQGFPVIIRIPEYVAPIDGPGRYRVEGVNRFTKEDATLHLEADSAANAKVKAELNDIIVTSVTKTA